jgi:glycosyltransferase involved in cell wall biosynthesis
VYLRLQSCLMTKVERHWCSRIALNVVMSEQDGVRLRQLAPDARVAVFENGVDANEFHVNGGVGAGVAYVGGTNPAPNLDALEYFCEQILPHLPPPDEQFPVRWIGRASAEQQQRYHDQYGVSLTGYVDDVRPLMAQAACHIVPLRVGGGTRLKILNAWAMGKAVVSTSVGCEGLEVKEGGNILIRDEPKAFADAVRQVLGDPMLRCRLGKQGRQTVERRYGWDVIGRRMVDTYRELA